jgi:hypothetical protein
MMVIGHSMEPTFRNHQLVVVSKNIDTIEKNDIVVFKLNNEVLVKKVVEVPGDTYWVQYKYPAVFYEPTSNALCGFIDGPKLHYIDKRHILPDEVFVIGENLNNSVDSRDFGPIKIQNIIGKVYKI